MLVNLLLQSAARSVPARKPPLSPARMRRTCTFHRRKMIRTPGRAETPLPSRTPKPTAPTAAYGGTTLAKAVLCPMRLQIRRWLLATVSSSAVKQRTTPPGHRKESQPHYCTSVPARIPQCPTIRDVASSLHCNVLSQEARRPHAPIEDSHTCCRHRKCPSSANQISV